jgi:CheY-specific phosphatase CheX
MDDIEFCTSTPIDVRLLKEKLGELVRYASQSRLAIHTDAEEVEVRPMDAVFRPGRILASDMVFILISGEAIRLTFKVHFNIRTARLLAWKIFGGDSSVNISEKQARDYFKEYGNLVAGSVVTLFGKFGIELGISLPLCTRGFYEVFSDYSEKQNPVVTYSDFWMLGVNDQEIHCSVQFEILDKSKFSQFVDFEIDEVLEDDGEEMMFL